ncbi:hypothetical protein TRVA0_031S01662 [Trichomonascus vanleenenianus]|uniref:uncharacterized protein n=1 Tax=Trichomonascus vanleenenianus TaxID=2268995 RepID=UPI003ECB3D8C
MIATLRFLAFASAVVSSALAGCACRTSHGICGPGHGSPLGHVATVDFNYTGEGGPLNWYGLNETANYLCAKGKNQSPIPIDESIPYVADNSKVVMSVPDTKSARLENIGDVVQVVTDGTLCVNGDTYNLAQFHFHTPSEHRVDLEYSPMENHWVFENSQKKIAVVTFLFELSPTGESVELFDDVFFNLNGAATPGDYTLTPPLCFQQVLDHFHNNPIYTYTGSLTTPPCTEGVQWYISKVPFPLDVCTYNKVKKVLKFNSRVTQNFLGHENLLSLAASELNA